MVTELGWISRTWPVPTPCTSSPVASVQGSKVRAQYCENVSYLSAPVDLQSPVHVELSLFHTSTSQQPINLTCKQMYNYNYTVTTTIIYNLSEVKYLQ